MPVFLARADVFTPTTICLNDAVDPETKRPVRVLTIACTVQNLRQDDGGNAFIVPIPTANAATLRSVDTSGYRRFVEDLVRAVRSAANLPSSFNLDEDPLADELRPDFGSAPSLVVFGETMDELERARLTLPKAHRPPYNPELMEWYDRRFPKHAFALCCFNQRAPTRLPPVMIVYEPSEPHRVYLPGLDARHGHPPDTNVDVWTDELVIIGTEEATCQYSARVGYTGREHASADARALLPSFAMGRRIKQSFPNGDYHGRDNVFRLGAGHLHRLMPGG